MRSSLRNMRLQSKVRDINFSELNVAHNKLITIHQEIRTLAPRQTITGRIVSAATFKEYMYGETVERQILYFPMIHGCEYRRKAGCLNCGMKQGIFAKQSSAALLKALTDWLIEKDFNGSLHNIKWFNIYNEGSWLDDKEVPLTAQRTVLELIATETNAHRITIESRPEYITEEKVAILDEISSNYGIEIEVGVGAETNNDFIRQYCINKGFTFEDFAEKVKLLQTAKNLWILGYKLFKPLFLSEYEAILDTRKSLIAYSNVGVERVSVEIMGIQEYTLLECLWFGGNYRLPWLWSVLTAVDEVKSVEIRLGGEPLTYYPKSNMTAHNCERCTEKIWRRIRRYNETHNIRMLQGSCECKEDWQTKIESEKEDYEEGSLEARIAERIIETANKISFENYKRLKVFYNSFYGGGINGK